MIRKRLVIIGNGRTASGLLDDLLQRKAENVYEISVHNDAFPRGCTCLPTREPLNSYLERGITFCSDTRVETLNPAFRLITDSRGKSHNYDLCVLASGSQPLVPMTGGLHAIESARKEGVLVLRTPEDRVRIAGQGQPGQSVIVVGGDVPGLEAACDLRHLGLQVTVVHFAPTLMSSHLDTAGSEFLRNALEQSGIAVHTSVTVSALLGTHRIHGVRLNNGQELTADRVVFACGNRPRVDLARTANIPLNRGILVNEHLATQIPGIYALGECAEYAGCVHEDSQSIAEQSAVLADVLTAANPQASYRGALVHAQTNLAGLEVLSLGSLEAEQPDDEVIQFIEECPGIYRKLVVRGDHLLGAVLVGPETRIDAATLLRIFGQGVPLSPNRRELLGLEGRESADPQPGQEAHVEEPAALAGLSSETRRDSGSNSSRAQRASFILKNSISIG